MRENGLQALTARLFRRKRHRGEYYRAEGNLLRRRPPPSKINEVWVADMTYLKSTDGWLYLAAIMDLYSRRIVGWSTAAIRDTPLAMEAFDQAWTRRGRPHGLVFHSDQGIEFLNTTFKMRLKACGVLQSTSRRGRCHDNAHMESFFHTLKTEMIRGQRLRERSELHERVGEYIDVFYNRHRRHSGLGFRSPEEYEARNKLR